MKKKLKCDRAQPCAPCARSSAVCKYPIEETTFESKEQEGKTELSPHIEHALQEEVHCQNNSCATMDGFRHPSAPHPDPVHGTAELTQPSAQRSAEAPSYNNDSAPFLHPAAAPSSMDMMSSELVSFHTTSPTTTSVNEFNQSIMGFDTAYLQGDFNFMSNPPSRIAGMAEGGVDWLNLELDSPNSGDFSAQCAGQTFQGGHIHPVHAHPMMSLGLDGTFQNRNYNFGAARFDQLRPQDINSPSTKLADSQSSGQQWPFDHTRNPEPQKYQLPPLRQILQGTIISTGQDSVATTNSLVQLLSAPVLPEIDLIQDLSILSAMDLLKNSLDLYFSEFHSVLPVVHIPTFNMAKAPTVTLAAMSCIGAMYSDDRQGTDQSWSLSEMCLQMIAWLVSACSKMAGKCQPDDIDRAVLIAPITTILHIS